MAKKGAFNYFGDKMKVESDGKNTVLKEVVNLNIALTLDCGQAFRWSAADDGACCGIAFKNPVIPASGVFGYGRE